MQATKLFIGLMALAGLAGCDVLTGDVTRLESVAPPAESGAPVKQAVARVDGGGEATFDSVPGLTSIFSVGLDVFADGSATGHFHCMIPDVVIMNGIVLEAALNDDGSVMLTGVGAGIDFATGAPVAFQDCPFQVTAWSGPSGVGRFLYNDCVVPPPGDAETVMRGHILIHGSNAG